MVQISLVLVQTVTVGAGGAASIEFTGIPQDGTDLLLVVSARTALSGDGDNIRARFNSDSGSNYPYRWLFGNGSSAGSLSGTTTGILGISASGSTSTANTFGNSAIYIPNYTSAANKSVSADALNENNATAATAYISAAMWNNTSSITSITLTSTTSSNLLQHSTASLYKIVKA